MRPNLTYFQWLCDEVGIYGYFQEESIGSVLFRIQYTYRFVLDENRAIAGTNLRQEFTDIYGAPEDEVKTGPCSVFEMLVALARDFASNADISVKQAYSDMMFNVGLIPVSIMDTKDEDDIFRTVDQWLEGRVNERGDGTPFPLNFYDGDARHLDLWSQMNIYIHEHYPLSPGWLE